MDVEIVGKFLSTLPEDDDHPYRTGPWRPQTTEWDADDLTVVEGEIPHDLDGVYLRNLVHYVDVPLPGPRLPHDMAFTENYAILNDFPLFWDPELLERNAHVARFHREMPSRFAIIPRRGQSADIQWFEADPTFVLHFTNAYEDGDEIVVDGFFQGDPEPADNGMGNKWQRAFRFLALDRMQARLHRWRFSATRRPACSRRR